jgi:lipid II:glycine glycyltransferase (peptidoglycan interpeptide bridge formation enzyme)
MAELARSLKKLLPRNTAFIRFDPPWYSEGEEAAAPEPGLPFIKATNVQAPDTVILDLSLSEEELLAQMKPKWRYNIGLGEKRGVKVSRPGLAGLDVFYRLLKETAERDGIAVHSIDYYRSLFEQPQAGIEMGLYIAEHEGEALAAIVTLFRGKEAVYLYGASSNQKRNLMAPHALQWRAIRDAKAAGCAVYDFFGIPPNKDPSHPMAGLYPFKTGFGGSIIHRPGCWDYTCKPLMRKLFSTAEDIRKRQRDKKKRR